MNKDIKYIYPVTRVNSIEKLLRTTAHNAFFVVTPLITEEEQREQSDLNPEAAFTPNIEMTRKTWQHRRRQNSFHAHTSLVAKQEEREQQQEAGLPLVLHGIILRSQLVTLLKNEAYFREQDGVGYYCHCFLHWVSCVPP